MAIVMHGMAIVVHGKKQGEWQEVMAMARRSNGKGGRGSGFGGTASCFLPPATHWAIHLNHMLFVFNAPIHEDHILSCPCPNPWWSPLFLIGWFNFQCKILWDNKNIDANILIFQIPFSQCCWPRRKKLFWGFFLSIKKSACVPNLKFLRHPQQVFCQ